MCVRHSREEVNIGWNQKKKTKKWNLFETTNGSIVNEKSKYYLKHKVGRKVNKFNILRFIVFENSTLGKRNGIKYAILKIDWSRKGGF